MDYIEESLLAYSQQKRPTGGFLRAVLANDLMQACVRADDINRHRLFELCCFVQNRLPYDCWGSYEKVDAWLTSD